MPAHRKLGRDSKQRRQLLRNLIDALFTRETLTTTWPKAKEAQSLAEKLITLGKKNDEASRRKAQSIFTVRPPHLSLSRSLTPQQRPGLHMPKLFDELAPRYAARPSGYTRVLRVEPKKEDQAPSAVLEFVDGPRDMRFALTARTLAFRMRRGLPMNDVTRLNVRKVTRYRPDGVEQLRVLVREFADAEEARERGGPAGEGEDGAEAVAAAEEEEALPPKLKVYPDPLRHFNDQGRGQLKEPQRNKRPGW